MTFPRRSKYGAVRTERGGRVFASRKEADRYSDLMLKERAGLIRALRCQVPVPIYVNDELVAKWVADFVYEEAPTWETIHEDCKGFRTPIYKLKAKLVRAAKGIVIRET